MNKSLPRPDRKLSTFVGSELLLDYVENKLDGDRKAAVEKSINEQDLIKNNVEQLDAAIQFCDELSDLKFTDAFVQDIEDHRGKIAGVLHKLSWSSWPDSLKWSSEAFLISCFVAIVIFATPWRKAVEFRQYLKNSFLVTDQLKPKKEISISKDLEKANVLALNTKQPETSAPVPETVAEAAVAAEVKPTEAPKATIKSYLYRINMRVAGIEGQADKLAAQIIGLGGERGGNVRIGWRKEAGNYFHFTIPEENYAELIKTLSQYGLVTVYKNSHPRVLPEGVLRFIVWIEDGVKEGSENSENTEAVKQTDPVENGSIDEE